MYCDNKEPLVSVIMGAYEIEKLPMFNRAIESILSQTMGNFELIICDDGSSDRTWDILNKYAKTDSRIILLRNDRNLGLAATLNNCIKICRGNFIARQDTDDISVIDRFEKQLLYLNKYKNIDFVGANVTLWDENSTWGKRIFPEFPSKEDFLFTMPYVHGVLMFRKECLDIVSGYRVAKETYRAEDYDMLMRMYARGKKGANIQEFLYQFCEDEAAQKRREYCYRIDEAIVRWKGFKALNLFPQGIIYVIKPLIVGLLPIIVLRYLKEIRKF